MKICTKCKEEKGYDCFYRTSFSKDGYNYSCKACHLKRDQERRKNDPVWVTRRKLQNQKYHLENREKISKRKKEWFESETGKKSHRNSSRKWKAENRTKVLAHSAVERAIKNGTLVQKDNCEICNSTHKVEAHHPDYRKRLAIIWLCKYCHEKLT